MDRDGGVGGAVNEELVRLLLSPEPHAREVASDLAIERGLLPVMASLGEDSQTAHGDGNGDGYGDGDGY